MLYVCRPTDRECVLCAFNRFACKNRRREMLSFLFTFYVCLCLFQCVVLSNKRTRIRSKKKFSKQYQGGYNNKKNKCQYAKAMRFMPHDYKESVYLFTQIQAHIRNAHSYICAYTHTTYIYNADAAFKIANKIDDSLTKYFVFDCQKVYYAHNREVFLPFYQEIHVCECVCVYGFTLTLADSH